MSGLAQRVDDRDADAVQAAGHLVAAAVAELAAGVQDGQDDLDGRPALLLHHRDRDAAAVVDDGDRVVGVDRDVDQRRVAGEGLVDGVVDHLVDEVMQAAHAGRPDVHAGALADRLETLEDGDVLSVVCRAVLVLRHVPPNDVKNPGSGLTDTRPGHQRFMESNCSRQGCLPYPVELQQKCCKTAEICAASGRQPDHPRGDTARQRSARTRLAARGARSTERQIGAMRSSSWAQTADEQVTTRTPSRSPVGSACAATSSPTACGPDPLDVGQERQRREPVGERRRRRWPAGRGSRRLMRRAPASRPSPRCPARPAAARHRPRRRPGRARDRSS